jgi:hypothetical protein
MDLSLWQSAFSNQHSVKNFYVIAKRLMPIPNARQTPVPPRRTNMRAKRDVRF